MDKSFGFNWAYIKDKQNQTMNVFRFTNFYYLGRNISPDYVLCTSLYRFDRNVISKVRAMPQQNRELFTSNNKIEDFNSQPEQKKMLPTNKLRMIHITPKQNVSIDDVGTQVLTMFKSIKMQDLKNAPQPIFWYSAVGLVPFLITPLTFMIFGYSRFLSSAELYYAAAFCSFAGGVKWGFALSDKEHTWENYGWAMVPQLFSWFTLLLPNSLGYLVVMSGVAMSCYVDLIMVKFPSWYRAIRLAVTTFALLGLSLAFIATIFN